MYPICHIHTARMKAKCKGGRDFLNLDYYELRENVRLPVKALVNA